MPYLLLTLIVSAVVAMFAVQNALVVPVSFFVWTFQGSLVLVIIGAVAVGALWAFLLAMCWRFKMSRKLSHKEQEVRGLTIKVAELEQLLAKNKPEETTQANQNEQNHERQG